MPNHVTTRCTVTGTAPEIARFRSTLIVKEDDALAFDFNAAIPMPEVLQGTRSAGFPPHELMLIVARGSRPAPYHDLGLYDWEVARIREVSGLPRDAHISDVATAYLRARPDEEAQGLKTLKALYETGFVDWYAWSIAKWGTKWGAYSFAIASEDPFQFTFDTAWSFPTPVFLKIAEMFPALAFDCACFDEGSNFAGIGFFNPPEGERPFALTDATDELFRLVYQREPYADEEEDEELPQVSA